MEFSTDMREVQVGVLSQTRNARIAEEEQARKRARLAGRDTFGGEDDCGLINVQRGIPMFRNPFRVLG